jgi:xanthine dehydrogenase YagR molybdenum-binding subunit
MAVQNEASAFHGRKPDEIQAIGGKLATTDGRVARSFAETLQSMKLARVEADAKVQPGEEAGKYSFHSFGAQFAQVRVDPDLGVVRVARMVSVFDVGRVMNLKTARSQALGGIIQGIGMALMEETRFDPRTAAIVTDNLADYLAPVNADVREIDVEFINLPDPYISPLGARGVGELAVTGVAPAIANAVFHATGKRVRDLPITIEKLIA